MDALSFVGVRFGRLKVDRIATKEEDSHKCGVHVFCNCDCGSVFLTRLASLRRGYTKSCGCLKRDMQTKYRSQNGKPACWGNLYSVWKGMMSRCYRASDKDYPKYGGRGIKVCQQWHKFANFENDIGERPEGTSLDRVDVDGNYEPGNCRWATPEVQQRNRRCNRVFEIHGERFTFSEVCQQNSIAESTLRNRLNKGMSLDEALSVPVRRKVGNHA